MIEIYGFYLTEACPAVKAKFQILVSYMRFFTFPSEPPL